MKKIFTSLLVLLSTFCYPQNEETGKTFISLIFINQDFDKAYSYLDASVSNEVSKSELSAVVQQIETQLGKFDSILEINSSEGTLYFYSKFAKAKIDIKITFGDTNKIIGFFFAPHKEIKKSDANDFVIKSGDINLKGTLLVPEKNNSKKLVIFVHGSGPQDRDETTFENKPFKDIAEGLLAQGIASYRFDKRTMSNPESFSQTSTIDDEYTTDVLNLISYFKNSEPYKDYEIILLGHSLGGQILPKIYNKDNRVSKLILMAANARRLDELIPEQYAYLYSLEPKSVELKQEVEKAKDQVAFLNSKSFTSNASPENLPFGLSYYYWKSILDYKPLEEVKKVNAPILVLQGERDYQVQMKDFKLWKKSISSKGSKFISYPTLNHLFIEGTGASTPQEYSIKGNVSSNVLKDICSFILSV